MKKFFSYAAISLLVANCATYKTSFSCQEDKGLPCKPMSEINLLINNKLQHEQFFETYDDQFKIIYTQKDIFGHKEGKFKTEIINLRTDNVAQ
jgi:hypothetical protein